MEIRLKSLKVERVKFCILLFTIYCLLFTVFGCGGNKTERVKYGSIYVITYIIAEEEDRIIEGDAKVFLNKEYIGVAPINMKVPVGTHSICVILDGCMDYEKSITVKENQETVVKVVLSPSPPSVPIIKN